MGSAAGTDGVVTTDLYCAAATAPLNMIKIHRGESL